MKTDLLPSVKAIFFWNYVLWTFALWDWNPENWGEGARASYAFFSALCAWVRLAGVGLIAPEKRDRRNK